MVEQQSIICYISLEGGWYSYISLKWGWYSYITLPSGRYSKILTAVQPMKLLNYYVKCDIIKILTDLRGGTSKWSPQGNLYLPSRRQGRYNFPRGDHFDVPPWRSVNIFYITSNLCHKNAFFLFLLSNSMIKSNINCLPEIINYLIKIT